MDTNFRQRYNTIISEELNLKLDIIDAIKEKFNDPQYKSENARINNDGKLLVVDTTDGDIYWTDPICVSGNRLIEVYNDISMDFDD